jgi:hypothetical protein
MSAALEAAPLSRLLREARAEGFEFGHTLANHLPMLLVILDRLGAPAARLEEFADTYRAANRLAAPPPPVAPITRENWTAHLGERLRESDYRAFFAIELTRMGPFGLQRGALPVLLPGIAASALHALMRLAYAHLSRAPSEVAAALAYWATCYLELPSGTATADTDDPSEILLRLQAMPHLLAIRPETDLLWHAIRAVGRDARFAAELDRLATTEASLPRFAAASLALYATTMDFGALHAVTSMHWLRLLPTGGLDRAAALRRLWRALAAAYPKMGMPSLLTTDQLRAMREAACPEWPDIVRAAIASDDEHDISLVFSAREEERHYDDPLYRRVAACRVGLLA